MTLKLKKITSPFNNKETFELFELKETTNNTNQSIVCQTCFRDVPISKLRQHTAKHIILKEILTLTRAEKTACRSFKVKG